MYIIAFICECSTQRYQALSGNIHSFIVEMLHVVATLST